MNLYIYIWNQHNLGNVLSNVYDHTHFCSISGQKKAKNGTLARQALGATDLKHGMHTQLDFGSKMGGIPPGHTSSHWCVKPKSANKRTYEQQYKIHVGMVVGVFFFIPTPTGSFLAEKS